MIFSLLRPQTVDIIPPHYCFALFANAMLHVLACIVYPRVPADSTHRPPPPAATLSSSSEDSSSDSSEDDDEDSGDGSELLFNNSPARPSSIPLHPTLPTSVNSDSDSSSSSSSSSEEESGEEEEQGKRPRVSVDENTVSMLEKVSRVA